MIFKTIASGSDGNCHALIADNGEILLLDCGISEKRIKIGIDFQISKIVGICITHGHSDHLLSSDKFEKMGIPVFAPFEEEKETETKRFGDFQVKSVKLTDLQGNYTHTNGDGSECPIYGFLIHHPEIGKLLYVTDSYMVKYTFKNINHILIGIDYDRDMIGDTEEQIKFNHVLSGHMEMNTALDFIKANNSDCLSNVIACHLSHSSIDGDKLVGEIKKVVDSTVHVATAVSGLELELKKDSCPF